MNHTCTTCIYFYDDGGELFGSNPHCGHEPYPDNIDMVMDF